MTTAFPTGYDNFPTTSPNDDTKDTSPTHSQRLNNFRDAIAAIEARVGITGEVSALSHDKRLATLEATGHPNLATHDALGLATDAELAAHAAAADPHTGYLKEEASGGTAAEVPDHTHASAAQAGTVAHSALTGLGNDEHTQYRLESVRLPYADIQDVSATDRILGRDTAGAGVIEEIAPSALRTMLSTPQNSEVILQTLADAAGDLIKASGADAWAKLVRGADDQVLRATASDVGYEYLSQLLAVISSTTTFANSSAENTLFTFTVPSAKMAVGDVLRLTAWGRYFNNTAGAQTLVWRAKFGSTTTNQGPALSYTNSAQQRAWKVVYDILLRGSSDEQTFTELWGTATGQDGGGWAALGTSESLVGYGSAALSIGSNQAVALSAQHGIADANVSVDIRGASLELIKP